MSHRPSHHHGRDGVLEDQLLLAVSFQNHGVLIEGTNTARQLYSAQQINRYAQPLLAGCVEEGILNVLRRLAIVHSRSPWVLSTATKPWVPAACASGPV